MARLEASDAAQNTYYADVNKPAEAAWAAGRKDMPKFVMPAGYGLDQHDEGSKDLVWSEATIRTLSGPEYDPACQP